MHTTTYGAGAKLNVPFPSSNFAPKPLVGSTSLHNSRGSAPGQKRYYYNYYYRVTHCGLTHDIQAPCVESSACDVKLYALTVVLQTLLTMITITMMMMMMMTTTKAPYHTAGVAAGNNDYYASLSANTNCS